MWMYESGYVELQIIEVYCIALKALPGHWYGMIWGCYGNVSVIFCKGKGNFSVYSGDATLYLHYHAPGGGTENLCHSTLLLAPCWVQSCSCQGSLQCDNTVSAFGMHKSCNGQCLTCSYIQEHKLEDFHSIHSFSFKDSVLLHFTLVSAACTQLPKYPQELTLQHSPILDLNKDLM